MVEKVVLWCTTGTWIKILAWMQMVWYGLKIVLFSLALIAIIRLWSIHTKKLNPAEENELPMDVIDTESEEIARHFDHHFVLVLVIATVVFICAYIFVIIMGVLLLKGYKQQNVPYLKSWLIYATVSIFWHVFVMIYTINPIDLTELIIFIPFYSFGIVIVYSHMNGILANQNPGGEELPKYETMEEEYV